MALSKHTDNTHAHAGIQSNRQFLGGLARFHTCRYTLTPVVSLGPTETHPTYTCGHTLLPKALVNAPACLSGRQLTNPRKKTNSSVRDRGASNLFFAGANGIGIPISDSRSGFGFYIMGFIVDEAVDEAVKIRFVHGKCVSVSPLRHPRNHLPCRVFFGVC